MKAITAFLSIGVLAFVGCTPSGVPPLSDRTWKHPSAAVVSNAFGDVVVVLPAVSDAISIQRSEGLLGNFIQMNLPLDNGSAARLLRAFGVSNTLPDITNIPDERRPVILMGSRTDTNFPWIFQFWATESNGVKRFTVEGHQPYN